MRRLPDELTARDVNVTAFLDITGEGDNPLYARVTQEDGHRAWTSPAYLFR